MDRRTFLKNATLLAGAGAVGGLLGCRTAQQGADVAISLPAIGADPPGATTGVAGKVGSNRFDLAATGDVDLAVATNADATALVNSAVEALGGIEGFVHEGDIVIIKPNLAWQRGPKQAATTSPEVLAAVIALCRQAGAGEVLVQEHTCATPAAVCLEMSGAKAVCEDLGVPLVSLENEKMYRQVTLANGVSITEDHIGMDILDCDVLINLPICKHHTATEGTFAMKNLMGTVWDRGRYHSQAKELYDKPNENLHRNIADLASGLRPTLNILDAMRALTTEGPQDGLIKELNTIVAGVDIVAVDAYGARLIDLEPMSVAHIRMAAEAGLGKADLDAINIKQV